MGLTHVSDLAGRYYVSAGTPPLNPVIGDEYFDTQKNLLCRWSGNNWLCAQMSTTSTSTTTTTSTSTSTTITTTSSSTSITTSTSTSTTTTL